MTDRRGFVALAAALCVLPTAGRAADQEVVRYVGEMTPEAFAALAARLEAVEDEVIGLTVSVPADGDVVGTEADDEGLSVFAEDYNLHFSEDFALIHGVYQIEGFFTVRYAGMYQGISALQLDSVDKGTVLLSGRAIKDIDLSTL